MPSKGVDYYFYVNNTNYSVNAASYDAGADKPNFSTTFSSKPTFQTGNTQINTDLPFHYQGKFVLSANTSPAFARKADINALTGNMESGDLSDMLSTPSQIGADYAISYGFYDSGPGFGDLTDQDQLYTYVTPNMSNWMTRLVAQNPQMKNAPFYSFTLPGAHDAGTFDLTAVNALLTASGTVAAFLAFLGPLGLLAGVVISGLTAIQAHTAIINLAVTQKDSTTTQLDLGCRYFDFRPGLLPSPLNTVAPDIYHIHTIVPGYPLSSFLQDIFTWLGKDNHAGEIVVVSLNTQGFASEISVPSADQLQDAVKHAQSATGSSIQVGNLSNVGQSYADLLSTNTRLLFLNQIDEWNQADKYDSYSGAYETTQPGPIIAALKAMTRPAPATDNYTVLQLQGTATTGKEVIVSCALSQSSASSPLMSTKAYFDSNTYPWVLANAAQQVPLDMPLVLLNDFVDNALANVAAEISLQRALNNEKAA